MKLRPVNIDLPDTAPDDLRLGHLLAQNIDQGEDPRLVILGFPSDEGVRRNGGRPGAADGPDAIRRQLYKLTPDPRRVDEFAAVFGKAQDAGNVEVSGDLEADHQALAEVVETFQRQGTITVILGGGHETAFGHFLGLARADVEHRIVNIDAHGDVRPLIDGKAHSGSPFRQAVEHPSNALRRYDVAGLAPTSVARSHLRFIAEHGSFYLRDELTKDRLGSLYRDDGTRLYATFCLDAVDQSQAPGVSAPATGGIPAPWLLHAARCAGANPNVRAMDVVELAPAYDRDDQTARLAAHAVWHFFAGLGGRLQD